MKIKAHWKTAAFGAAIGLAFVFLGELDLLRPFTLVDDNKSKLKVTS